MPFSVFFLTDLSTLVSQSHPPFSADNPDLTSQKTDEFLQLDLFTLTNQFYLFYIPLPANSEEKLPFLCLTLISPSAKKKKTPKTVVKYIYNIKLIIVAISKQMFLHIAGQPSPLSISKTFSSS